MYEPPWFGTRPRRKLWDKGVKTWLLHGGGGESSDVGTKLGLCPLGCLIRVQREGFLVPLGFFCPLGEMS